ncbi:MAG: bifunctional aminoglycoside phosphotransferase/ATP-binding protein [Polaromonas sp.]
MEPNPTLPQAASTTLIQALRARLQADTGQPVALVETHISWVLLAGCLAYKLKKPVRLPFLDFSTLALRRHFCHEEVRLNRRLAPALYLGVLPVHGTAQAPRLGTLYDSDSDTDAGSDAGKPVDFLVCMQRFAPQALLSEQLAAGRLQPRHLDGLALRLADFHRAAPPLESSIASPAGPADVARHEAQPVRAVLSQLQAACNRAPLSDLRGWVEAQLPALQEVFSARRQAGAVREGHGDLHLANAVLIGDEAMAFDCIEFDPALRWIDVMSDVAFLTMDLKAHGRPDLAFRFLDGYLQRSGDYGGLRVLRFYEVYRALVRSLVACVRAQDAAASLPDAAAPDYLACAQQLAGAAAGKGRLLITHGLSGSGKSTLAGQLLEAAGAIRLRSDVERKRLFGLDALQRSTDHALAIYTPQANRRTFERLKDCARTALQAGYPVIVDAAFLRRAERRAFEALAAGLGVPFSLLHCRASPAQLRQRVAARSASGMDASEADLRVLEGQLANYEPLDDHERAAALEVVTDEAVDMAALCASWLSQA